MADDAATTVKGWSAYVLLSVDSEVTVRLVAWTAMLDVDGPMYSTGVNGREVSMMPDGFNTVAA